MNTKTLRELRSIAKNKGLRGFYKPRKADLLVLLLEQSTEEMPAPAARSKRKERRSISPVKIIPSPQEVDELEKEEIKKSRAMVKDKPNEWYDWLIDYLPKPIKKAVSKVFSRAKNNILGLYDGAKKTLKDIVEKEAEEEQQ